MYENLKYLGSGGSEIYMHFCFFYERFQTFVVITYPKRFYPIISKTKVVAPKIKLLEVHVISSPSLS